MFDDIRIPRLVRSDVDRRYSSISPTDIKANHFQSFASAASFIDIVKMVPVPAEERPGWMH